MKNKKNLVPSLLISRTVGTAL